MQKIVEMWWQNTLPSQAVFFLKRGRRDLRFLRRRQLVGDTRNPMTWAEMADTNFDDACFWAGWEWRWASKSTATHRGIRSCKSLFFSRGIFSQVSWWFSRFSQWLFFFMVMFPTNLLWFSNGFRAQICTRLRHGKHGHFQVNLQHPRWIPRQAESGSRLSAWQ